MVQIERSPSSDTSRRAYQGSNIPCRFRSRARFSACPPAPFLHAVLHCWQAGTPSSSRSGIPHFDIALANIANAGKKKKQKKTNYFLKLAWQRRILWAHARCSAWHAPEKIHPRAFLLLGSVVGKKQRALTAVGQHPKGQCYVWLAKWLEYNNSHYSFTN